MADNNYPANHGQSPFRQYVPVSGNGVGKNDAKSVPSPSSIDNSVSKPLGGTRRNRHTRSRWRRWVQPPSPKATPGKSSVSSPPPSSSPSEGAPAVSPRSQGNSPSNSSPVPPPNGARSEPSRFVRDPAEAFSSKLPSRPNVGSGTTPPTAQRLLKTPPTPPRRSPVPPQKPQSPSAKVTPLRRQPAWSTPASSPSENFKARRDRKPRRSTRKPPQPVLYGIRLLILGTGIAAIVGTVLSSFNANQDLPTADVASESARPEGRSSHNAAAASPALAQPLPLSQELVTVKTDLIALESMTPGLKQSIFFYDLATGNYIDINGSDEVAAASTIKMPILVAFLQAVDAGTVQLDQAITLREEMIASGSGEMQFDEIGTQYTALEVATEMIVNSDNTATNLIISLLGGIEALNQQFRDWGLEATVMRNLLPDLDGTNTTSSADLVRVMALVDQGELLTLRSRDRLFSIMQRTLNRSLIPDGLTDDMALAYNKTGDIGTSLGDVALVDVVNGNRYVLSVLVERPFNDGRASELIRRVSERLYEEMSQPVNPLGAGLPEAAPASEATNSTTDPNSPDSVRPNADDQESYVDPSGQSSDPEVPRG